MTAVNAFGANGLISRTCPGASGKRFYTFDQQGSVAQRINASGAVTSTDAYDAWGGRSSTGAYSAKRWLPRRRKPKLR